MSNLPRDGFDVLRQVVTPERCEVIGREVTGHLKQSSGAIGRVGGRNLQSVWDGWREVVADVRVRQLIHDQVGLDAGLVRILFFDKPPGQTWNLALHRDQTIAVAEHPEVPDPYSKPTLKAGVPHVVAGETLLRRMLTLRLHLDAMHADNGPLIVAPGSHDPSVEPGETTEIHCAAGDVFVMMPLLLHGSRASSATCQDHRRVVHLEFAPAGAIADAYRWYRIDAVE